MDRREGVAEKGGYLKDLEESKNEPDYNDMLVEEDGNAYRVPYRKVREVVFSGISKADLIDMPHAARLQYRLMLMDSVLRAKVEFVKGTITIVYNPTSAENRKEKISLDELMDFLSKEGVRPDPKNMKEREFDYYEEIYKTQFNPKEIRDHPPYGVSREQWEKMKPEWESKVKQYNSNKLESFHEWQNEYAGEHPEIFGNQSNVKEKGIFGGFSAKKKKSQDKGFWFHGA